MNPELVNRLITIIWWLMMVLAAWNLVYPWRKNQPRAGYSIHTPWLLLPLWIIYEFLVPPEIYMRVDYLILLPVFLITLIIYLLKVRSYRAARDL